ncbi:MAG TPA: MlaD family protein [Rhodanobacteraceae bacterium]|nr:MlaD family protein [Rhodanobacteraceae bacterium]
MENRAHAIVAVCFLIVFAVAAALIVYWLSSGPSEPVSYRIVTSQSVAGLAPQSQVEFKGIAVGHVQRIRFDPKDRSRVIVDFNVQQGTYITHATYAVLSMHGITGGETLELKLGKGSREPLATNDKDPAKIPLRKGLLAQLEDSAKQSMKDLQAVLDNAKKVLDDENREHISASIRQIDAATAKLVQIETELMPAMKQMPALMQSAQKSLDESHALLTNANRVAVEARTPVRKAGKVEDTIQHLGRKLDRQTAPDVEALSQSLSRTSRQLEDLIRELKAKPQSLIFGPAAPPPGPGEPGFQNHDKHGDGHD